MSQLIRHERIETTVPRAKELRKVADRMITLGKEVRYSSHFMLLSSTSRTDHELETVSWPQQAAQKSSHLRVCHMSPGCPCGMWAFAGTVPLHIHTV